MCGIFGAWVPNRRWKQADVQRAIDSLSHRGPDGAGYYCDDGVLLGNTRLAIQDITHGDQPMYSEDRQIVVVQNGEIYNFVELRAELKQRGVMFKTRCDTEVILRLYEAGGVDALTRCHGMFAIALFDCREQKLHLIRDRLGVKPLFAQVIDDGIIFASEIKTLRTLVATKARINQTALSHYLSFNYVPPPLTLFEGIEHVPPGSRWTRSMQGLEQVQWYSLESLKPQIQPAQEWDHTFLETLRTATERRLRSDAPVGAFLSGGLDSSSVVAQMAALTERPVQAFVIGFDDPRYDETAYARAAASRFGAQLMAQTMQPDLLDAWRDAIYYCDQPHGDISFLPTWQVSRFAGESVKVVLTGDGGDELFGGYSKYQKFFEQSQTVWKTNDAFLQAYWPSMTLFSDAEKRRLFAPTLRAVVDDMPSQQVIASLLARFPNQDRINQALLIDTLLLLPGNNLVKPDRMGMAASIEARSPYLDTSMLELAFQTPGTDKIRQGITKFGMKRALAPALGDALTYRAKQMFTVPVGEWFRTSRYAFGQYWLGRVSEMPFFERDFVRRIWTEHQTKSQDRTREIRALIALALWVDVFEVELETS